MVHQKDAYPLQEILCYFSGKINIFLEKVNMYSIQEMQIKRVTLEDKVLDYVDIHKKND